MISRRRSSPLSAERHRVRAFLQSLAPHRESVAVPVQNLDAVSPPAGEHKQVSGEGIQFQVLAHQGVQAVKTLALLCCSTKAQLCAVATPRRQKLRRTERGPGPFFERLDGA